MRKLLDQILVVDVECTCWQGSPPPGEVSEIIEIGLCTIDVNSLERIEKRSIIVKPERSRVSDYCRMLTSLTQVEVNRGVPLKAAFAILENQYLSQKRTWASYGNFDRQQVQNQCIEANLPYPFSHSHINVKNLFSLVYKLPHEVGMSRALELLKINIEGLDHRGADDAWNIAKILITLLDRKNR